MRQLALLPLSCVLACGAPEGLPLSEEGVGIEIKDGYAELSVTRTFSNTSGEAIELSEVLVMPAGGAASDFVIRYRDRSYEAQIMKPEEASTLYDELSRPANDPDLSSGPPVLIEWADGQIKISAHPFLPGETLVISYLVRAPLQFEEGHYFLDYREAYGTTRREVLPLVETHDVFELSRVGRAQLSSGRAYWTVHVDVPPVLEPIPTSPSVVFVFDGSVSLEDPGFASQLALASAYLSYVPDARVEVIVFARRAQRMFGSFVGTESFAGAARALADLAPANGSSLDAGLLLAEELLASMPEPRRIVAFTDGKMRSRFGEVSLATTPAIRNVGLVSFSEGALSLFRDDDWEHVSIASSSGGFTAMIDGDPRHESTRDALEELVHPIKIDYLAVRAGDQLVLDADDLPAGASRREVAVSEASIGALRMTGEIWGRKLDRELRTPSDGGDPLAAMSAVQNSFGLLEFEEIEELAFANNLLSTMTSMVAHDGPRPIGDVDVRVVHAVGFGGFGFGTSSRCGGAHGSYLALRRDLSPVFRARLAEAGCAVAGERVSIELELGEILDVAIEPANPCLEEAAWGIDAREFDEPDKRTIAFQME